MRYRPAVFLVHGGQRDECLACAENVACPECGGRGEQGCKRCKGLGSIEEGSGGHALIDGECWTYRRYSALRRVSRSKFWEVTHQIGEVTYCKICGGRGWISRGGVFGAFLPDRVEYILRPKEKPKRRVWLAAKSIHTIPAATAMAEKPRAGKRQRIAGSFFAVTTPQQLGHSTPAIVNLVCDLIEMGDLESGTVSYYGSFVRFLDPIPRVGKQFRGLKRFELDGERKGFSVLEGVE